VHHWFLAWDASGPHRWEVWQTKDAGGQSMGHVHRDLMLPYAGVGGGSACVSAVWTGDDALRIGAVLDKVGRYAGCSRYRYWPGPNSNTFVSWVLKSAGIQHRFVRKALGRRYPVPLLAYRTPL
jgi:hypothetical protein